MLYSFNLRLSAFTPFHGQQILCSYGRQRSLIITSRRAFTMSAPIDFAALHREREARKAANKRERSISPPASRKAPKLEEITTALPSGARLTSFTSTVQADQNSRKSAIANAANDKLKSASPLIATAKPQSSSHITSSRQGDIIYPHGIVKKTWAFGHERDNDIKLEEVLEPMSLRHALISAFQWDMDWVLSKLKLPATKCVFVMQAKELDLRRQILEDTASFRSWLRICFPPMEGQTNCMHSKLMLLFHANKLRIAIPTANLLNFDWGETGVMENSVFIIDLPRLEQAQERRDLTVFGEELMFFLDKQGLDEDVKDGVLKFDFSATKDMAFVSSIGGISKGDDAKRSGLQSLSQAVRQLNQTNDDIQIDFAASSIGNLNDNQLKLVHAAACGKDVFEMEADIAKKAAATFFKRPAREDHSIRDKIRIYFPTKETVQASTAGAAGTICLSRQYFEDMKFPRRCFVDYKSARPGLLSHNKIMYVRPTSREGHSWVYVGSANMSESAWGKPVYNKKEKRWHMNSRNWECGVLLPVHVAGTEEVAQAAEEIRTHDDEGSETESEAGEDVKDDGSETASEGGDAVDNKQAMAETANDKQAKKAATGTPAVQLTAEIVSPPADLSIFDGILKAPFMYPGTEYGDREPWYFKELQ